MRRFVIVGHTQRTQPPIPLNDAAGAGGRWDVLARCVTSALLVSHGIRHDTEIVLALQAGPRPRTLHLDGQQMRGLNPDERSTLALLSRALEAQPVGLHAEPAGPGVRATNETFAQNLEAAKRPGPLVWLDEAAPLVLENADGLGEGTFVLSDHQDFTPAESELLAQAGARRMRLGPAILHADQCIVLVHHFLDLAGPRM